MMNSVNIVETALNNGSGSVLRKEVYKFTEDIATAEYLIRQIGGLSEDKQAIALARAEKSMNIARSITGGRILEGKEFMQVFVPIYLDGLGGERLVRPGVIMAPDPETDFKVELGGEDVYADGYGFEEDDVMYRHIPDMLRGEEEADIESFGFAINNLDIDYLTSEVTGVGSGILFEDVHTILGRYRHQVIAAAGREYGEDFYRYSEISKDYMQDVVDAMSDFVCNEYDKVESGEMTQGEFSERLEQHVMNVIEPAESYRKAGVSLKSEAERFGRSFSYDGPVLFQEAEGVKKGVFYTAEDGRHMVELFRDADITTAIHEFGHFFFTRMFEEADRFGARAWLKRDVQTIKDVLGDGLTERELHEKLADSFCDYVLYAVSQTVALDDLYDYAGDELIDIYKEYGKGIEIPERLKEVFSRISGIDGKPADLWSLFRVGMEYDNKTRGFHRHYTVDEVFDKLSRLDVGQEVIEHFKKDPAVISGFANVDGYISLLTEMRYFNAVRMMPEDPLKYIEDHPLVVGFGSVTENMKKMEAYYQTAEAVTEIETSENVPVSVEEMSDIEFDVVTPAFYDDYGPTQIIMADGKVCYRAEIGENGQFEEFADNGGFNPVFVKVEYDEYGAIYKAAHDMLLEGEYDEYGAKDIELSDGRVFTRAEIDENGQFTEFADNFGYNPEVIEAYHDDEGYYYRTAVGIDSVPLTIHLNDGYDNVMFRSLRRFPENYGYDPALVRITENANGMNVEVLRTSERELEHISNIAEAMGVGPVDETKVYYRVGYTMALEDMDIEQGELDRDGIPSSVSLPSGLTVSRDMEKFPDTLGYNSMCFDVVEGTVIPKVMSISDEICYKYIEETHFDLRGKLGDVVFAAEAEAIMSKEGYDYREIMANAGENSGRADDISPRNFVYGLSDKDGVPSYVDFGNIVIYRDIYQYPENKGYPEGIRFDEGGLTPLAVALSDDEVRALVASEQVKDIEGIEDCRYAVQVKALLQKNGLEFKDGVVSEYVGSELTDLERDYISFMSFGQQNAEGMDRAAYETVLASIQKSIGQCSFKDGNPESHILVLPSGKELHESFGGFDRRFVHRDKDGSYIMNFITVEEFGVIRGLVKDDIAKLEKRVAELKEKRNAEDFRAEVNGMDDKGRKGLETVRRREDRNVRMQFLGYREAVIDRAGLTYGIIHDSCESGRLEIDRDGRITGHSIIEMLNAPVEEIRQVLEKGNIGVPSEINTLLEDAVIPITNEFGDVEYITSEYVDKMVSGEQTVTLKNYKGFVFPDGSVVEADFDEYPETGYDADIMVGDHPIITSDADYEYIRMLGNVDVTKYLYNKDAKPLIEEKRAELMAAVKITASRGRYPTEFTFPDGTVLRQNYRVNKTSNGFDLQVIDRKNKPVLADGLRIKLVVAMCEAAGISVKPSDCLYMAQVKDKEQRALMVLESRLQKGGMTNEEFDKVAGYLRRTVQKDKFKEQAENDAKQVTVNPYSREEEEAEDRKQVERSEWGFSGERDSHGKDISGRADVLEQYESLASSADYSQYLEENLVIFPDAPGVREALSHIKGNEDFFNACMEDTEFGRICRELGPVEVDRDMPSAKMRARIVTTVIRHFDHLDDFYKQQINLKDLERSVLVKSVSSEIAAYEEKANEFIARYDELSDDVKAVYSKEDISLVLSLAAERFVGQGEVAEDQQEIDRMIFAQFSELANEADRIGIEGFVLAFRPEVDEVAIAPNVKFGLEAGFGMYTSIMRNLEIEKAVSKLSPYMDENALKDIADKASQSGDISELQAVAEQYYGNVRIVSEYRLTDKIERVNGAVYENGKINKYQMRALVNAGFDSGAIADMSFEEAKKLVANVKALEKGSQAEAIRGERALEDAEKVYGLRIEGNRQISKEVAEAAAKYGIIEPGEVVSASRYAELVKALPAKESDVALCDTLGIAGRVQEIANAECDGKLVGYAYGKALCEFREANAELMSSPYVEAVEKGMVEPIKDVAAYITEHGMVLDENISCEAAVALVERDKEFVKVIEASGYGSLEEAVSQGKLNVAMFANSDKIVGLLEEYKRDGVNKGQVVADICDMAFTVVEMRMYSDKRKEIFDLADKMENLKYVPVNEKIEDAINISLARMAQEGRSGSYPVEKVDLVELAADMLSGAGAFEDYGRQSPDKVVDLLINKTQKTIAVSPSSVKATMFRLTEAVESAKIIVEMRDRESGKPEKEQKTEKVAVAGSEAKRKASKPQVKFLTANYSLLSVSFREKFKKSEIGKLSYSQARSAMKDVIERFRENAKFADEKTTEEALRALNVSESEKKQLKKCEELRSASVVETVVSNDSRKQDLVYRLDSLNESVVRDVLDNMKLSPEDEEIFKGCVAKYKAASERRLEQRMNGNTTDMVENPINPVQLQRLMKSGAELRDIAGLTYEQASEKIKQLPMTITQAEKLSAGIASTATAGEADKAIAQDNARGKYPAKTVYPYIQKAIDRLGVDYPGKSEGKPCLYKDYVDMVLAGGISDTDMHDIVKYSLQDKLKENAGRLSGGKLTAFAAAVTLDDYITHCIEMSKAPLINGSNTDKELYDYMVKQGYNKDNLQGMSWEDANAMRMQDAYGSKLLGYQVYSYFTSPEGSAEVAKNKELRDMFSMIKSGQEIIVDSVDRNDVRAKFEFLYREIRSKKQEDSLFNDKLSVTRVSKTLEEAVHTCACRYVQKYGTTNKLLEHLAKEFVSKNLRCFPGRDKAPALMSDTERRAAAKAIESKQEYDIFLRAGMNAIANVVPEAIMQGKDGFKAVAEAVHTAASGLVKKFEKEAKKEADIPDVN